jgi:DNA-binding transcriptional regulator YiaG
MIHPGVRSDTIQAMNTREVLAAVRARTLLANGEARKIREGAKASRSDIAHVLGVKPACIGHWETGRRRPRTKLAAQYAELLSELARVSDGGGR